MTNETTPIEDYYKNTATDAETTGNVEYRKSEAIIKLLKAKVENE